MLDMMLVERRRSGALSRQEMGEARVYRLVPGRASTDGVVAERLRRDVWTKRRSRI